MDADGYPDDEELAKVTAWPYTDCKGLMDYLRGLWWMADWGWTDSGDGAYAISTGGWSGNESLISAMQGNQMFWVLCWISSRRGGHYEFELPAPERRALTSVPAQFRAEPGGE